LRCFQPSVGEAALALLFRSFQKNFVLFFFRRKKKGQQSFWKEGWKQRQLR
jgi:hypothetical protein